MDVAAAVHPVVADAVAVAGNRRRASAEGPLHARLSEQRRFATLCTDLEDYRKVRSRLHRDDKALTITVNDVVLATLAGALRSWLMQRGDPVPPNCACVEPYASRLRQGGPGGRFLRPNWSRSPCSAG